MHFVVVAKDKPDPSLRLAARADHLEFVSGRQQQFVYGGPLIKDGTMVGSVLVLDLPDRAALDSYLAEDPYFARGIFASVEVYESRWMVPERDSGALAAEAARARS
jgi:uncharacterized protein YciI